MTAAAIQTPPNGGPPADKAPSHFPMRKRTGTAHRRLLTKAVDTGVDDLASLSPLKTVQLFADARWGSTTFVTCPHCGTMDEHGFSKAELRWKCFGCKSRFSVTSGTTLADHKLDLNKILRIAFQWAQPASGRAATDIRKEHRISYRSAYVLAMKLREGLMRGFNVGLLCGVQEMDGLDLNGKRHKEKRNNPQSGGRLAPGQKPKIPAHLLAAATRDTVDPQTGEIMGPPTPPKLGKTAKQPADRRLLIVMRQRGLLKKRGAIHTRVCIAMKEAATTVVKMAQRFSSAESNFMTDEDTAYYSFKNTFNKHQTVNHSEAYARPGGVNNNQAESFNHRMRRCVEQIHLTVSNKYLADYACEVAWREDLREPSTGTRLRELLRTALNVGLSQWWRGYWQGHFRGHEVLIEGEQETDASGKKPGAKRKRPR